MYPFFVLVHLKKYLNWMLGAPPSGKQLKLAITCPCVSLGRASDLRPASTRTLSTELLSRLTCTSEIFYTWKWFSTQGVLTYTTRGSATANKNRRAYILVVQVVTHWIFWCLNVDDVSFTIQQQVQIVRCWIYNVECSRCRTWHPLLLWRWITSLCWSLI